MRSRSPTGASIRYPLMRNNIQREDLDQLIAYLQEDDPRLTQGSKVLEFEKAWSEWLGVKHSVFVNSGASANLISLAVMRELRGVGEVIVPPLTWVSDIAAIIHNGFSPVFVDIDPVTLGMNNNQVIEKVTPDTKAVFLTHVQGFNGLSEKLLQYLSDKDVPLIEDVCEAHGATFQDRRLGSFGLMSNFSFYYAHHMSTIEGGMVCTDDIEIDGMLRMFRSHGMSREAANPDMELKIIEDNPKLNPDFIFLFPAYNVRSTEVSAVLGLSQLKRLDENNKKRQQNHRIFLENLDGSKYKTDFNSVGSCNYAFNVVLQKADYAARDEVERLMRENGIEYRRGSAGGGNQMRQPYLSGVVKKDSWNAFPEVEHIHFFGWYIGNYPDMSPNDIVDICTIFNRLQI